MVGNHADIVKVVQLYPLSSTFQKASRRFITVDADYNAIETELLKIHATGIREVFIKTRFKIGRASCRERVCQYVYISVVAVSLKKKTINKDSQELSTPR